MMICDGGYGPLKKCEKTTKQRKINSPTALQIFGFHKPKPRTKIWSLVSSTTQVTKVLLRDKINKLLNCA